MTATVLVRNVENDVLAIQGPAVGIADDDISPPRHKTGRFENHPSLATWVEPTKMRTKRCMELHVGISACQTRRDLMHQHPQIRSPIIRSSAHRIGEPHAIQMTARDNRGRRGPCVMQQRAEPDSHRGRLVVGVRAAVVIAVR